MDLFSGESSLDMDLFSGESSSRLELAEKPAELLTELLFAALW